jgi:uncharacterized protein YebE (UPF0316 family)
MLSSLPVLPPLIFLAETCVLTLATLRTISIARGKKVPAAVLGFFEVSIWLFAIGQVMQNLTNLGSAAAFAAGFALGNYLGVLIEQKLALGSLSVKITTKRDAGELIEELRSAGYGVTRLHGQGATGPVEVVVTVVQRKDLPIVAAIIQSFDSGAFYAVHELKTATEGVFPRRPARSVIPAPLLRAFQFSEPERSPARVVARAKKTAAR